MYPFCLALHLQTVDLFLVPRTIDSGWPYHNDLSALGAAAKDWQSLSVDYAASKLLSGFMALDVAHQFWYAEGICKLCLMIN